MGSSACAQEIRLITSTLNAEPGGTATFSSTLSTPIVSDAGEVIFDSDLRISGFADGYGVYRGNGITPLTRVLRSGSPTPASDGNYERFADTTIASNGDALFWATINNSLIAGGTQGVYRVSAGGSVTQIARTGGAQPPAGGTFFNLQAASPRLTASGTTFFRGDTTTGSGVFRHTSSGLAEVYRANELYPPIPGSRLTTLFGMPQVNDNDQVAFYNRLTTGNGVTFNNDEGHFFWTQGNGVQRVLVEGTAAPGAGGGVFGHSPFGSALQSMGDPSLNEHGDTAFFSWIKDSSNASIDDDGIFLRRSNGALSSIARGGELTPNGNGRFADLASGANIVQINNLRQVAFAAPVSGASGGSSAGIFLHDTSSLKQVVRLGDTVAGVNGKVSGFGTFALNNQGQISFLATFDLQNGGSTSDGTALLIYDAREALEPIVQIGSSFGGGTINALRFAGQSVFQGRLRDGLSDLGHVGFHATVGGEFYLGLYDPQRARLGDFDGDRDVDAADLAMLYTQIGAPVSPTGNPYDIIDDNTIDQSDVRLLIEGIVGAFPGDSDLDGRVDVADLGTLASNWQTSGNWLEGDFDFSGFVDVNDLGALASNWQAGTELTTSFNQALASVGLSGAVVPEPVAMSANVLGLSLLRRRKAK
jgi:hypothetical protein